MKKEIKVGDKVMCIRENEGFTIGKMYTVLSTADYGDGRKAISVLNDNNDEKEMWQRAFKLVEKKTDPIVESVVSKFLQRSKVGIEKYGTTLHENNVDCFLEHTQLELMDAVNYIEKLKSQREESIQSKVIEWAKEKQILCSDNAPKQIIKLTEEVRELASAFLKSNDSEVKDAIGDVMIVLTILCKQLSIDMNQCYADAYEVIKDRTGKTINGTFVKDEE